MKICVAILYIFIDFSTTQAKLSEVKSIPVIDALIPRLEAEVWSDHELSCRDATLRILYGVRNDTLWATWIWDSMQLPVGVFYGSGVQLGNFYQCLNTPWASELKTQYCLVDVEVESPATPREFGAFDSATEYLNTKTVEGRIYNQLAFGVCMPSVCSPLSVTKVFSHMVRLTHIPAGAITLDPHNCQEAEQEPYSRQFWTFWTVIAALTVIAIVSTFYSYCSEERSTEPIVHSFCLNRNWNDLFKVSKSEIKGLHGIRFLTAFLNIVQHFGMLTVFKPSMVINTVAIDEMLKTRFGKITSNANTTVDTFFAISGLLLIKSLLTGRQKNLLLVLVKRYIRLIGPYGVVTIFVATSLTQMGSGPLWPRSTGDHTEICEQHWWKNFLMISDFKTMCNAVGWYVPCEYHLAIMATLLYFVYRRNKRHGVIAFFGVSCILITQLGVKAYWKKIPLVPFGSMHDVPNIRDYSVMNDVYVMWQDRAGSYLVGIAMGYLMTLFKPDDYRNVISKTSSFIMLVTSLFVMFQIMTISYWFEGSSVAVAAAVATYRIVWAFAVCAIIGALEYGSIPGINNFLGSSLFVPLSKLSYGLYLTHFYIMQRSLQAASTPLEVDAINMMINVLGNTILSCVASLYLYLIIEAPLVNISNAVFSEKSYKKELNCTTQSNGIDQEGNGKLKES